MVFDGRTLLSSLDPSKITIATVCSHTSLQIFHGARKEGFRTLGIAVGEVPRYFELLSFRVIDERRFNAKGDLVTTSEATIKVSVGGRNYYTVADGNGPVNALDHALRQALAETYPALEGMQLVDYKVRILAPEHGTAAVTRVIIESGDGEGRVWQTVGVSGNIIDASYDALRDAIAYKLLSDGARAPAA